ncbi:OsmC family protein [Phenylobacterium sp.]|uniref:OsmC family protein n=1 Tax=Phenylobacterium sp. TaxID=1871053 RepID=UPI0025FDD7C6|nr:OsmC family protein [Phenylobacterium sp.]
MATYRATIDWVLEAGGDFPKGRYSRAHTIRFQDHIVPGTASAQVIGARWAAPGAVDPEQMLVASLSTCHMLTFLHVARLAGFVVTAYRDEAVGVMENNAEGAMAVTRVTLHPEIGYEGARPTDAERDHLHHQAHEGCFIANSVKTEVMVEEVVPASAQAL